MKNQILYKVTYTSIDNKVRELIWNATYIDEYILNNIVEHIQTGKPLTNKESNRNWNIYWGISRFECSWSPSGHSNLWQLPNKTQYTFYYDLVQLSIIRQLSKECSLDEAFGKQILKAATSKAKQHDEEEVAHFMAQGRAGLAKTYSHIHRDALTRAKRRLRYYQTQYTHDPIEESEFGNMIEEYRLFNILSIECCH